MLDYISSVCRRVCIVLAVTVFGTAVFFAQNTDEALKASAVQLNRELEAVKSEMETLGGSPESFKRYERLMFLVNSCDTRPAAERTEVNLSSLGIAASLCINGSLAAGDPDFNRVQNASTGSGIAGAPACSLSASGTAVNYDFYSFNLTGCAAFPTEVTMTLCGPAGCQHLGNTDTVLYLYRNVPAGDPLTANGGLPAVFNPASPCTNVQASQDDLGTTSGTTNIPGGSTCNQVIGANCVGPCTSPSNAAGLSGMRRQLGSGRFTVVVAGFGNATAGPYNLYVDAPGAGCAIALAPTAANVNVSGRVVNSSGRAIANAVVTINGPGLSGPVSVRSSSFGYYRFEDLELGSVYTLAVSAKRYTFNPSVLTVSPADNVADANFVSEQ